MLGKSVDLGGRRNIKNGLRYTITVQNYAAIAATAVVLTDAPGLGVDFDENEAERYSYERGYHPIVRLEDGTMWNY